MLKGHPPKLRKQWFEPFNRQFVRGTVGGENAVAILQIGVIVTHLETKKIRKPSARFFEDYLRSTCVPELCARAWVDVDVTGPVSDEADLEAD